jgi:hypothetical protein
MQNHPNYHVKQPLYLICIQIPLTEISILVLLEYNVQIKELFIIFDFTQIPLF